MKDENPFKDKLYQHTLPVRDEVWQAIEKNLPEKEDRKLPIFWFILFASTLIGGSLMLGYTRSAANPVQPVPQDSSRAITVQPDLSEVNYTITSEDPAIAAVSSDGAPSSSGSHTGSTASFENSHLESFPTVSTSSIHSSTNTHLSNTTATPNSSSTSANTSKQSGAKTKSSTGNTIASNAANGVTTTSPSSTAATTSVNSTTTNSSHSDNGALGSPDEVPGHYVTPTAKRSTRITRLLPGLPASTEDADAWVAEMATIRPDPSCYKFSSKGGQYFFSTDFFSGPGWSPRTFSDAGGDAALYSIARKSTESSLYAWSAGARFNMHLHNGFAIRLGILYDQAGDVFDYTDTLATRSTTRIDSFFAADGSFIRAETIRVLEFGTLIKRINNTYRHLDVPILLSYEMALGRSTFMINAGPVFNLTSSHRGQILDPMLVPRHITPGQPDLLSAYKTSLGLSVYLGAGIVFPLTNHFAGLIEPRYLYRIKPVTIKSYPLEEHRHYAGLNIGLRYFFK